MGSSEPVDVFISCSNRDRGWARWLDSVLREAGCETTVQEYDFKPGESFAREIHKALEGNLAVLLQATDRSGEAQPLLRRALAIWHSSLGPDHPNTVMARENLDRLLADLAKSKS